MQKRRRFECVQGTSRKFWEVTVKERTITVGFGRLGSAARTQTKQHSDAAKAKSEAEKLVRERLAKGYVEVGSPAGRKPLAKTSPLRAKRDATASDSTARVVSSLLDLARGLALEAYASAEWSGDLDRYSEEGDDEGVLWDDYWHNNYRYLFFGAFYTLSDEMRAAPGVRGCVKEAAKRFARTLADTDACFAYLKKNRKVQSDMRLAKLRYFDGQHQRKLEAVQPFDPLAKRIKKDGF